MPPKQVPLLEKGAACGDGFRNTYKTYRQHDYSKEFAPSALEESLDALAADHMKRRKVLRRSVPWPAGPLRRLHLVSG
jgi:hypothetical protein